MKHTFITERNDEIDNAVFQAIQSIHHHNTTDLVWNMSLIGEVADYIESLLQKCGFPTCHPWYYDADEEIPCYDSCDRCAHCQRSVDTKR